MKYQKLFFVILCICLHTNMYSQRSFSKETSSVSAGIGFGYNGGTGLQLNFTIKDFAEDFPFNAKVAAGIAFVDAGKPLDARSVFINDNKNGIPEESGRTIDFRIDLLLPISSKLSLYTGPRFIAFTGNFNFVGGNEDFDVTGNQWGVGAGIETLFTMTQSFDLVFNIGYDFYFENTLYGHDTSYSPNNENINPRKEYEFADADKAVSQPTKNICAMFGFSYNF
jgi:hypothetical protein